MNRLVGGPTSAGQGLTFCSNKASGRFAAKKLLTFVGKVNFWYKFFMIVGQKGSSFSFKKKQKGLTFFLRQGAGSKHSGALNNSQGYSSRLPQ